jgi:hypothetical protein
MTKKSPEDRLMELEDKKTRIEARLKLEREAIGRAKRREHAKILNRKRKDDTRRKILLGAAMMKKIEDGSWQQARMLALMDEFLDKTHDRELFELKP